MPSNSIEINLLKSGLQNPTAQMLSKAVMGLSKSAVPVILAPNGTVATNGVVTLGTALPLIYTAAWVRLPAGAVVGGLAGLYYVVFSSTTVGQVYTNFADVATAFVPTIPSTLVAAVGSNAAYTQATGADVSLANVTIAGNTMGVDGAVETTVLQSNNGTAGAKTVTAKFGGSAFLTAAVTTSLALETSKRVVNRGVVNKQLVHANSAFGNVSTVAPSQLTVDTSADVALVITGQLAVATDYLVIENFSVTVRLV
jgi:hypothetical protein